MKANLPCSKFFTALLGGVLIMAGASAFAVEMITLDAGKTGRAFEGLGALSAGASSRLLMDYPEPQRSEILDFLFKPNYGAALQHLKVEIGGDMDSTDGTEPSIARTREEFLHPKPEYFNRGYEWWLMKEAKKRNPAIIFDVLQWGAPGWVGNGKFYSQDNADFIVAFIKGAKQYHNLDISYCGIWNERPYNVAWIKLLRETLDRAGFKRVQIVAADEVNKWTIADKMATDPELRDSVQVVGTHYPKYKSTPTAQYFGKPVWANEDGPWNGNWAARSSFAATLPQIYNRNHVVGKMTKTIIWSPITSYFDILPLPGSGLMRANQPWSGHYDVQPAVWATAHTTQFIQLGWKYLDDACRILANGGSCVAAVAPDGKTFSIVIETVDAKQPQEITFRLAGGLSAPKLRVWHSDAKEQFIRQADLSARDGVFQLTVEPDAIYSLTTTDGQFKGIAKIPSSAALALPYHDNFANYRAGQTPRYLADFYGVFETAQALDGRPCLAQTLTARGITWADDAAPVTLVGDAKWRDYEASCDAWFDFKKDVELYGRVMHVSHGKSPPDGYRLRVTADGNWQLDLLRSTAKTNVVLLQGSIPVVKKHWHRLGLRMAGNQITVLFDEHELGRATDGAFDRGFVGLGCDYEFVRFSDFSVLPISDQSRHNRKNSP